ncbi:hypothetical protein DL769_004996 [Monosporascus sp. CRB-8-3]|nr:hypothetical protein DL769_004996 [Monosporascus sp. CRB-8-3]
MNLTSSFSPQSYTLPAHLSVAIIQPGRSPHVSTLAVAEPIQDVLLLDEDGVSRVASYPRNITRVLRMFSAPCHLGEASRWESERVNRIFNPEIYEALRTRASRADHFIESTPQMVTTQFQIVRGRAGFWDLKTFTDLPTAIPNEAGLYVLVLETPPTLDGRFGRTGLDIYCGQAKCDATTVSKATGLALRLSQYERQMEQDPTKLQALHENTRR